MPALIKEMTIYLHAAITRFTRCRAPVIAAVGGAAAGAVISALVFGGCGMSHTIDRGMLSTDATTVDAVVVNPATDSKNASSGPRTPLAT